MGGGSGLGMNRRIKEGGREKRNEGEGIEGREKKNELQLHVHFHRVFEGNQSSVSVDCPERAAVLQCASEVVREGRREQRKQEMRTELVRQLQEAEVTGTKENLKVCGVVWSANDAS